MNTIPKGGFIGPVRPVSSPSNDPAVTAGRQEPQKDTGAGAPDTKPRPEGQTKRTSEADRLAHAAGVRVVPPPRLNLASLPGSVPVEDPSAGENDLQTGKTVTSETIVHRSGDRYTWPARTNGDYRGTGQNSLFSPIRNPRNPQVTGGLPDDKYLMYRFATFGKPVASAQIDTLFRRWDRQIPPNLSLRQALRAAVQDQDVFNAVNAFFSDGGRFEAWRNSGRYHEDSHVISIGLRDDPNGPLLSDAALERRVIHEVSHYVSDKEDALFDRQDAGGADHFTIEAMEKRFLLLRNIRNGAFPLIPLPPGDNQTSIYTDYTDSSVEKQLDSFYQQKDWTALSKLVDSEQFYTSFVHGGMVPVLSKNEALRQTRDTDSYSYSPAEIQDLAALHAYNAILIRESVHLAVALSQKRGVPFDQIYRSGEYQRAFNGFVVSLANTMTDNPTSSVRENGRQLMGQIIGGIR
jgi:hypothetical protein